MNQFFKFDDFRDPCIVGKQIGFEKIEEIARALQCQLWIDKEAIWDETPPEAAVDVLNPAKAFAALGYEYELAASCGQYRPQGRLVEVAGYIDPLNKKVGISMQFPVHAQNFTAAHELGHAVLHPGRGMHRDRSLTVNDSTQNRPREEIEADKFATYFLMPEKLVRKEFADRFGCEVATLNDETAYCLTGKNQEWLRSVCNTSYQLAVLMATANRYGRSRFPSLTEYFTVSPQAMAIRLRELQLVVI